MGTNANAKQPKSVDAHSMPIPLNIWRANRGNPAAVIERRKVFAAIAEAALDWSLVNRARQEADEGGR